MKITLNEIIEKLDSGIPIQDTGVKVRKKIPHTEKMYIIEGYQAEDGEYQGLAKDCIEIEDGMYKIEFGLKEIMTVTTIILNYSNIILDVESSFYETVINRGIYRYIYSEIDLEDIEMFKYLLESNIKQNIELFNSPVALLNRKFNAFLDLIPKEESIKKIIEEIKNIDDKKIDQIKQLVTKYTNTK
jgi:hypothetical protein